MDSSATVSLWDAARERTRKNSASKLACAISLPNASSGWVGVGRSGPKRSGPLGEAALVRICGGQPTLRLHGFRETIQDARFMKRFSGPFGRSAAGKRVSDGTRSSNLICSEWKRGSMERKFTLEYRICTLAGSRKSLEYSARERPWRNWKRTLPTLTGWSFRRSPDTPLRGTSATKK
jgi:hypothetical protein